MALTQTTLASAVAQTDTSIVLTSATTMAIDTIIRVGNEWMKSTKGYVSGSTTVPVLRGLDGSAQIAHSKLETVNFSTSALDFSAVQPVPGMPGANAGPNPLGWQQKSYAVAGAIDVKQHIAVLAGTVALAMTLADPTADMDGQFLLIVSNGKAAHTIAYTNGLGGVGASADVGTFASGAQASTLLVAFNKLWMLVAGTTSAAVVCTWA